MSDYEDNEDADEIMDDYEVSPVRGNRHTSPTRCWGVNINVPSPFPIHACHPSRADLFEPGVL